MDKTNYDNLYYATYYFMIAEDFNKALPYFEELKKVNYTGESTSYYAKNAVSDQEEYYGNTADAKNNRDNQVRLKLATTPRDEKTPSRKADIAKYIASIYISQGKNAEAKAAIEEAKQVNPDDINLLNAEAEIYLKMGDMATYRTLTEKIIEKNPNDYNLFFNLGIASAKTDPVAAENYYQKAILLNPDFQGSYINLAILKMRDEQKIIDEMNKLGTSEKDNKRYEVLKKQRDEMYRSAIPSLEKAYELKPETEVEEMLLNIYGALEMTDKKKALKTKLGK
jgi:tetratricopeptide (TPR) repeat protein